MAGGGDGGMNEGVDAWRALAFPEGGPEPCLLEGAERGCGGQRGTWWPQDGEGIHTLAGEEERDGGRPGVTEAGLFRGRKTTQLRETAMESEEEGRGPPCHRRNP